MNQFLPEDKSCLATYMQSPENNCEVCYGLVKKCDRHHNLLVEYGDFVGIIPREETAIGADSGKIKEISIISKVGKIVSFVNTGDIFETDGVQYPLLSRKKAQLLCQVEYIDNLQSGDIIDAVITHFESFGAFVDIGCGIVSLLPIDCISVSRISHPKDRFCEGDKIKVAVTGRDNLGRITISHKELLGTWCENAEMFHAGETVFGVVRSVESYGIFVELTPNLAGLAERKEDIVPGDYVSVFIKNILPEKMKVKLIIIDKIGHDVPPLPSKYFTKDDHIDSFYYSPDDCVKQIYRIF